MWRTIWLRQLSYILLYTLAFLLPISFGYSSLCIIALIPVWLISANYPHFFREIKKKKIIWAFVLYFLLFALSYFNSDNTDQSAFDILAKTPLLILPIIIGAGLKLTEKQLEHALVCFLLGVLFTGVVSIYDAIYGWLSSHSENEFFYHELVSEFQLNAVYMALYSFLAVAMLLLRKWQYYFKSKLTVIFKSILILFFSVYFFLLAARMLILLFVVFLIPYFAYKRFKHNLKSAALISLLAIAATTFIVFLATDNPVKKRFADIFNKDLSIVTLDNYADVEESDFSNLTLRLFMWRVCIDNVRDNNLWIAGAGNGDAQQLQNDKMKEYGIRNIHPELALRSPLYNVNVHNMYLQSLLMVGILGIITLLTITIYPYLYLNKLRLYPFFLAFHVSSFFFMMQESMLQTQAGIVYYALFYSIFINQIYIKRI